MIKTIVPIYPEESVYSWLARICVRSGYVRQRFFFKEVYKKKLYPDLFFIGALNEDFIRDIREFVDFKKLLLDHTLFKYYVRFLDLKRKRDVYNYAINNNGGVLNLLAVEMKKEKYFLRYCPKCVEEDRAKYGEAYFHINHSFPRVHICAKHKCELVDTSIGGVDYRSMIFLPLEMLICSMEVKAIGDNNIRLIIAKYIDELFHEKINLNSDVKASDYLDSMLDNKYVRDTTGFRNNSLLVADLQEFYKDLDGYSMSLNKMQTMFCNQKWNSYELSLLALFEGIRPHDLALYKGYKGKRNGIDWKSFDKECAEKLSLIVSDFKEKDKIVIDRKWASEKLNIKYCYVRDNMPLLRRAINNFKGNQLDWKKLDQEYCDELSLLIKNEPMLFDNVLITKKYISSLIGVKDETLRRLPKLKEMVFQMQTKALESNKELDEALSKKFLTIKEKRRYNRATVASLFGISDLKLTYFPKLREEIKKTH